MNGFTPQMATAIADLVAVLDPHAIGAIQDFLDLEGAPDSYRLIVDLLWPVLEAARAGDHTIAAPSPSGKGLTVLAQIEHHSLGD
ncbi:hypothetical protein FAM22020_001959 [Propionibacterium freudenreichii]|uniref:hypothetical protein n=1 Tax=Propionibacterium freudenreichii TaxID=1744 RepID=UPI00254A37F1|nr:hypothetical protein [Propionibacterium freudenreichii]MDK9354268.1 hypothetical protein [Propionibacterium freudenreichii]MDK9621894.1 hypothetical protein [Propionibacterium freudenreichii]